MTTPESTSVARSPRRRAQRRRRSSSRTSARDVPRRTASRAAQRSGPTRRWRWRSGRSAPARSAARPDPAAVLKIVERVMREGEVRHGAVGGDLGPQDARALLRAWLESMDLDVDANALLDAPPGGRAQPPRPPAPCAAHPRAQARRGGRRERRDDRRRMAGSTLRPTALGLFDACIPAIPYAAAAAFLGREKAS